MTSESFATCAELDGKCVRHMDIIQTRIESSRGIAPRFTLHPAVILQRESSGESPLGKTFGDHLAGIQVLGR